MSKYTNKFGLSNAIARAIISLNDDYDKVGWKSVTALVDSPRCKILYERHADEIVTDVSDLYWSFIGNMGHLIAERGAPPGALVEQRHLVDVLGKEISFKPDSLEKDVGSLPTTWTLRDFKFTSIWTYKKAMQGDIKDDWVKQMNLYVYLLEKIGFPISSVELEICGRDWRKVEQIQSPHDYPERQSGVVSVPIWLKSEQKEYIESRVELYKECEQLADNELPKCSFEERWAKPDRWAVVDKTKSPDRFTGLRPAFPRAANFKSDAEARAFIARRRIPKPSTAKNPRPETLAKAAAKANEAADKLIVEYRKSHSTRCEDGYCAAAKWCNQFHEEIRPAF